MSSNYYEPPAFNNINFRFTQNGYVPPKLNVVNFNFSTRQIISAYSDFAATLEAQPLYVDEAYSYIKHCPKYVMGYGDANVQILSGRCLYGGIRDLTVYIGANRYRTRDIPAYIRGTIQQYSDLISNIRPYKIGYLDLMAVVTPEIFEAQRLLYAYVNVLFSETSDLVGALKSWRQIFLDLGASLAAVDRTGSQDLFVYVKPFMSNLSDIIGYIHPFVASYTDLSAYLNGIVFRGDSDIGGYAGVHFPEDLTGAIKVWYHGVSNIGGYIRGFVFTEFSGAIEGHPPKDLIAYARSFQRVYSDLDGYIHGWQVADLMASISKIYPTDLNAYMGVHFAEDLTAYLNVWSMKLLTASIYAENGLDLTAYLNSMQKRDLLSIIYPILPVDIHAFIKGIAAIHNDLGGYIRGYTFVDIPALVSGVIGVSLGATITGIGPIRLGGFIHGWQLNNLLASVSPVAYPYDLFASIYPYGGFKNLLGSIKSVRALEQYRDLPVDIQGFQTHNLSAYLNSVPSVNLYASMIVDGASSPLWAIIIPSLVRLTKIVRVLTMEHIDLNALINVSCFYSNFSNLSSYINSVYFRPLTASIKGIILYAGETTLSATVGYDKSYLVLNVLPITVSTIDASYRVFNMLPFTIRVFGGATYLTASIVGAMVEKNLTASINGVYVDDYDFESAVSRIKIYDIDERTSIATLSSIVELMFSNYIKDYIYLDAGEDVFSMDWEDKWVVSVKSFLPANTRLRIKRKFKRATSLFNLTKYATMDEAVRAAIDFVTLSPSSDLMSCINLNFNSLAVDLPAMVSVRYTQTLYKELESTIVPIIPEVVVSEGSGDDIEIL